MPSNDQAGLNVSTQGSRWFARGSGAENQYYSLEATVSADGATLSDGIIYFGASWPGTGAGTFAAHKDGPRTNYTCRAPQPAPPAPPPAPNLWPLPRNYSTGGATGSPLLVPSASFRFDCDPCAEVLTGTAFSVC